MMGRLSSSVAASRARRPAHAERSEVERATRGPIFAMRSLAIGWSRRRRTSSRSMFRARRGRRQSCRGDPLAKALAPKSSASIS